MSARIETRAARTLLGRRYWWNVFIARNGEILATSETFTSMAAARRNIAAMKTVMRHGEQVVP